VTTTESSKNFVKEETGEDEEEIFPSFYPTISIDEDPLKRQVFFFVFFLGKVLSPFCCLCCPLNATIAFCIDLLI